MADSIRLANWLVENGNDHPFRYVFCGRRLMSGGDQAPIGSPFGSKSEPEEVMSEIDLTGRNAIVTGATRVLA